MKKKNCFAGVYQWQVHTKIYINLFYLDNLKINQNMKMITINHTGIYVIYITEQNILQQLISSILPRLSVKEL